MRIKCPDCENIYEIDETKVPGNVVYGICPKCQKGVHIKKEIQIQEPIKDAANSDKFHENSKEIEGMKNCPFCGKQIPAAATKCKHCREDLEEVPIFANRASQNENLGYLMLIIPVISTLLIWFWVGSMNLFQSPGTTLTFLGLSTIIVTALLGAYEAQKLGFGKPNSEGTTETRPIGYFFGIMLLWIFVYPAYLYQRSKKGKKNLLVPGILIAFVFAYSWYEIGSSIEDRIEEIRGILGK